MRFDILATFAATIAVTSAQLPQTGWNCTNSLGTCNNACYAVSHGLAPDRLTYDADEDNRDARRTASGCSRDPCSNTNYRQWGGSCDEYPFASTHEGGKDAVLRCVEESKDSEYSEDSENSEDSDDCDGGDQLEDFYEEINDGDQFDLFITDYQGATFCENPNAQNDGSEFHLVDVWYNSVKFRRDASFADAVPMDAPRKFREFEDENGTKLLLLNRHFNGTKVGSSVFYQNTWVKIVKEL